MKSVRAKLVLNSRKVAHSWPMAAVFHQPPPRRQEEEVVGGLRRFQAPRELLRRQRAAVAAASRRGGAKEAGTTGEGLGSEPWYTPRYE